MIDFTGEIEDQDGDGDVDGADLQAIGLIPGSGKAKAAWQQVEAEAKAHGHYMGKPLRPGAHPGDGDFDLVRDKLIWHGGHSPEAATRIAAKVRWNLAG